MTGRNRAAFAAGPRGPHNAGDMPEQKGPPPESGVEHPGKLMRIAMMVRELLEEVRRAPIDEGAREHLGRIHERVFEELKTGLSGALAEELERIALPLSADGPPTESELRVAQAQLLGWLEGLFQGIQAAIATQQLAAAQQLEELRRQLPQQAEGRQAETPGQYL